LIGLHSVPDRANAFDYPPRLITYRDVIGRMDFVNFRFVNRFNLNDMFMQFSKTVAERFNSALIIIEAM